MAGITRDPAKPLKIRVPKTGGRQPVNKKKPTPLRKK